MMFMGFPINKIAKSSYLEKQYVASSTQEITNFYVASNDSEDRLRRKLIDAIYTLRNARKKLQEKYPELLKRT